LVCFEPAKEKEYARAIPSTVWFYDVDIAFAGRKGASLNTQRIHRPELTFVILQEQSNNGIYSSQLLA
jgi:hypothetical protein